MRTILVSRPLAQHDGLAVTGFVGGRANFAAA